MKYTKLMKLGMAVAVSLTCGIAFGQTGKMVLEPRYAGFGSFGEGLAPFMDENEKWGYIDTKGKVVIAPRFDSAGTFSYGEAWVRIGDYETGKTGCVDKNGTFKESE